MKQFSSHAGLRRQLEYLNLGVGLVLILISLVYMSRGAVDSFANWFIFGCMYMVMDKYWTNGAQSAKRVKIDMLKYCIGVAAFFVSVGFLLHIL